MMDKMIRLTLLLPTSSTTATTMMTSRIIMPIPTKQISSNREWWCIAAIPIRHRQVARPSSLLLLPQHRSHPSTTPHHHHHHERFITTNNTTPTTSTSIIFRRQFSSSSTTTKKPPPPPPPPPPKNLSNPKQPRKQKRSDPFARRPTAKCDPYDQGGKPMNLKQAQDALLQHQNLLIGVSATATATATTSDDDDNDGWTLVMDEDDDEVSSPSSSVDEEEEDGEVEVEVEAVPFALARTFRHPTYLDGSKFVHEVIGAVCEMNQHYAYELKLYRVHSRRTKTWQVQTSIKLRTVVLGGLSSHDFMLASLIDIELERPDNRRLLLLAMMPS